MRHLFLLLVALCFLTSFACPRLFGVLSTHTSYYEQAEAAGIFKCLDGSKTVPFSAVNNDVCDCVDGSDEPGTSACAALIKGVVAQLPQGWKFRCSNVGFFEQEIPHSRVKDGICDCCDGSDEGPSGVSCPNRCTEVEKELARQQAEAEMHRKIAFVNRAAMQKDALKRREEALKALPKQEAERKKITAELPSLEKRNEELQKSLEPMRETLRQRRAKWDAEESERDTRVDDSLCIQWRQTGNCKPTGPREPGHDKDCNVRVPPADSGFCECNAAYDSHAVDPAEQDGADSVEENTVLFEFACGHPELSCKFVCSHTGEAGVDDSLEEPEDAEAYTTEEARTALVAFESQKKRLAELDKSIAELTELTEATAVSTEELLRTLEGKEFTIDFQDYTYAVTMFKEVHQRNQGQKSGGPLLGRWKSFAENTYSVWAKNDFDLTQMLYDDGARCWNGVTRKVDIHLVCGPENRLTQVEEPAMCIYRMVFETPAICDE